MSNQGPLETGEETVTRKQKDQIKQRNQSDKRQIIQRMVDKLKEYPLAYSELSEKSKITPLKQEKDAANVVELENKKEILSI